MYKHFIFCVQFIHSHINKHTGTHTYTCTQKRFSSLFSERTCRSFWHVIEKCWKIFGCTNIFYIGDYILYIYIYIIYIYMYIYICICIYIYICNQEKDVPFRLSRQWLCGNSCTWPHDVRLHIAYTNEPKSAQQAKQEHNIRGHQWSTTHRMLKSHKSKMSLIYMQSWRQCALPVNTTMVLWQLCGNFVYYVVETVHIL